MYKEAGGSEDCPENQAPPQSLLMQLWGEGCSQAPEEFDEGTDSQVQLSEFN